MSHNATARCPNARARSSRETSPFCQTMFASVTRRTVALDLLHSATVSALPKLPSRLFEPARGLRGAHAQTIYATYAPTRPPRAHWERWATPDGDFLDVQVTQGAENAPQVLLLHGLESDPHAMYMRRMVHALAARGMGTWAVAFRGCGHEPNRLLRTWHAAESGDARFALEQIRARTRGPVFAVGFSLGASALLHMLIEDGEAALVDGAAAVSTPFDLALSADVIDGAPFHDLLVGYRARFLVHLVRKALAKERRYPGAVDREALKRARTLRAYDDAFTAPVHGFGNAENYYAVASVGPRLSKVRIPTLVVSALDDPMVPPASVPRFDDCPAIIPVISDRGGHVAFVEGSWRSPRFYCEPLVADTFAAMARER